MNLKSKLVLICSALLVAFFTSCEYEVVQPEAIELPPEDEPISFSETIEPIFTSKCAACHISRSPVLTKGNVYNSLTNGYIDTDTPANSSVYRKISSGHPSGNPTTATENAFILRWIEEGAQNN